MIKYVELEAVYSFLPEVIKQDVDATQIKSWAYQAYREFNFSFAEEHEVAVLDVVNHKAKLPPDIKRLSRVWYSSQAANQDPTVQTLLQDYGDYRLIVYQEIFFSSPYYMKLKPLAYKGQMRSKLITEDMYCSDCEVGFSIDSRMGCLTIDLADGEITIEYMKPVEDDGQLLIPDDPSLLKGLSWWIQAQYWLEKAYSHEDRAMKFYENAINQADHWLSRFTSKRIQASINPEKHRAFRFGRNRYNWNYKRNAAGRFFGRKF